MAIIESPVVIPQKLLPSNFDINYVHLLTNSMSEPIDITKLVNYIEIFESIYSPFMTININISDSLSLVHLLSLVGEEYIEIDIREEGGTGVIQHAFSIYKLSDRTVISDRAVSYTLHCISGSAIIDMNTKISKAYNGQPSDIVSNLLCRKDLSITKPIYSHQSRNVVSYISNYWSPIENIKYLCDRTISNDTNSASYLFFENKSSFVFAPLDRLVAQASKTDYLFTINTHDLEKEDEKKIIHKLYVDEGFDYIERVRSGAYGNTVLLIDSVNKSYSYQNYDFIKQFDVFNRLNKKPFATNNSLRNPYAVFRTRSFDTKSTSMMPDEQSKTWFGPRLTELASIVGNSMSIDVAGDMNVVAGDVVNIAIPHSMIDEKTKDDVFDATLSGRYLVTSMKHLFDRERHTMTLQLNKDSLVKL